MSDHESSKVGAAPRGELSQANFAKALDVHPSRIVYWLSKGWVTRPLTFAQLEDIKGKKAQGLWPPKGTTTDEG